MNTTHVLILSALLILVAYKCTKSSEKYEQLPLLTTQQFLSLAGKYGPPDDIPLQEVPVISRGYSRKGLTIPRQKMM